ncbi:MAG: type II secretion system F family protein [Kiritimatiellae bacterium]|nr:type II secretion system F family protein [Kiritimatiellia bacterium]
MSVFTYRGRDRAGRRQRGWIEADSPKLARSALDDRGILTETLAPAALCGRLRAEGRARLYRELGVLLRAGFNLERALGMLMQEGQTDQHSCGFLAGLRARIREGQALHAAMAELTPRLPPFERAALQAAEQAGLQGQLLEQLADFLDAQRGVAERLRGALLYPVTVLVLATGLLSLMMFVVLPRATRLFAQFGSGLPPATRLVATLGPRVMLAVLLAIAAAAATWLWARRAARDDEALAARLEQASLRLPFARAIVTRLWSMRFAGTMALLVQAGVTPQESLATAGAATGSRWVAALASAQAEQVRHGLSLSAAMASLPPLAPHLTEWVRVGESAGNLYDMLSQAAQRCRQAYEARLTRILALLEPALILLVGLAVLIVAYTVLKPMLDLARTAASV